MAIAKNHSAHAFLFQKTCNYMLTILSLLVASVTLRALCKMLLYVGNQVAKLEECKCYCV